jgi:pimeloyl-ACP methyl ester carboxylesterase
LGIGLIPYFLSFSLGIVAYKFYIYFSKENILENYVEKLISNARFKEIPNLIKGKTGFANNLGIKIFYEDLCTCKNPISSVLLINGSSETLIQWSEKMIKTMLKNNLRVIRFDNRGVGLSDWILTWSKSNSYNLNDMALDALAVTNHLKIDRFHLLGYSMGGMISQILAINYPQKILSMTSVMSSAYLFDPEAEKPDNKKLGNLKKLIYNYQNKKVNLVNALKFHFKLSQLWVGRGNYVTNHEKELEKVLFEIKKRKGYNRKAYYQHNKAIKNSGSRYTELKKILAPTLLLHGTDDPLIKPSHSKKIASLIHGSKLILIKGMGHDFNKNFKNRIISIILPHILINY